MPLVVPSVARYAINATYHGEPCVNILDYSIQTTEVGRETDLDRFAAVILAAWSKNMLPIWTNQYVANSVDWVDLDSELGSTGTRTTSVGWAVDEYTWPKAGLGSSQGMPGNVAMLVSKGGGRSRSTRSGRMFLAPGPESGHNGNILEPTYAATVNTALTAFLNATRSPTGVPMTETMVTVHKPSLVNPSYTPVTSLTVNTTVSTQRRRVGR